MRHSTRFVFAALIAMCSVTVGHTIPPIINYQGQLTDAGGTPLNGSFDLTFNLYDDPGGGASLWTETHFNVPVVGGLFNVLLGENSTLTDGEFSGVPRYLGVTVEADPEMSPRTEIASVGYSFRTATVDSASGGTIVGDLILKSTGSVNAMEINQGGFGRGLRIGMDNPGSSETALAIAMQSSGTAITIVPDGGGAAIDVIGGFGDGSVNLPNGAISSFEIEDETITSDDLANNSVTSAELASNSVNTSEIVNSSILNSDIAPDEVNSDRLENEPGAAQSVASASFNLSNTVASYRSVSITAPTSGYALVIASATGIIVHNNGQTNTLKFGVSETGTSLDSDQAKEWTISSATPGGTQRHVLSAQKIFPAVSGSNTYHLSAIDAAGNSGKQIADMTISVVFIPTAYGSVSQ